MKLQLIKKCGFRFRFGYWDCDLCQSPKLGPLFKTVLIRWDGVKVKVLYPLGSGDKIRFVLAPILKTVSQL